MQYSAVMYYLTYFGKMVKEKYNKDFVDRLEKIINEVKINTLFYLKEQPEISKEVLNEMLNEISYNKKIKEG